MDSNELDVGVPTSGPFTVTKVESFEKYLSPAAKVVYHQPLTSLLFQTCPMCGLVGNGGCGAASCRYGNPLESTVPPEEEGLHWRITHLVEFMSKVVEGEVTEWHIKRFAGYFNRAVALGYIGYGTFLPCSILPLASPPSFNEVVGVTPPAPVVQKHAIVVFAGAPGSHLPDYLNERFGTKIFCKEGEIGDSDWSHV